MRYEFSFNEALAKSIVEDFDFTKCRTVRYKKSPITLFKDKENDVYKLSLKASSCKIKGSTKRDNIYFIINGYRDEIMYIGKSNPDSMKKRLKEHLLKNETKNGKKSSTASKISKVYKELKDCLKKDYHLKLDTIQLRYLL